MIDNNVQSFSRLVVKREIYNAIKERLLYQKKETKNTTGVNVQHSEKPGF